MKNHYKTILIILGALLYLAIVEGQTEEKSRPVLVPPSPNASSLGIFGEVPVSIYTGVPNITIPLYEIVSGPMRIPINLQYHASGIRVAQEASWVGLGWALNAGGVISRTIRGWDDFRIMGDEVTGYITAPELPQPDANNDIDVPNTGSSELQRYTNYRDNWEDPEPDIFFYNFGNYSGKMLFPKKEQINQAYRPVLLDQQPLQVEFFPNNFTWQVKTPDGCTYYFGTGENTTIYSDQGYNYNASTIGMPQILKNERDKQSSALTSWHLDSIQTSWNDKIRFTYRNQRALVRSHTTLSIHKGIMEDLELLDQSGLEATSRLEPFDLYYLTQFAVNEAYLEKIEFRGGSAHFVTRDRSDLLDTVTNKAQQLSRFYVLNQQQDTVCSYRFVTGYFGGTTNKEYSRLRLDAIKGFKGDNYTFAYHRPDSVPSKKSLSVDHWGYYNGKRNSTVLPAFLTRRNYYSGANRDPDEKYTKMLILKNIQYPTGGYSAFDFALNRYSNAYKTRERKEVNANGGHLANGSPYGDVKEFTIEKGITRLIFDVEFYFNQHIEEIRIKCGTGENEDFIVYAGDVSPAKVYCSLDRAIPNGWESVDSFEHKFRCGSIQWDKEMPYLLESKDFNVTPGRYRLKVTPSWSSTSIRSSITYFEEKELSMGGGLRVEQITQLDGEKIFTTRYKYTEMLNGKERSTGKLMSEPKYIYDFAVREMIGVIMGGFVGYSIYKGNYVACMSDGVIPLGTSAQGCFVGYDQVTEIQNSETQYGKTVHYFRNKVETTTSNWFPGLPNRIANDNGFVDKVVHYDANQQMAQKTKTHYDKSSATKRTIKGLKVFTFPIAGSNNCLVKFYDNVSEWWYPTIDSVYHVSGKLKSATSFSYGDSIHKQVTEVSTMGSDKVLRKTTYKYPSEYNTAPYTTMHNLHIWNPVIESQEYKGAVAGEGRMTRYKNFGNNLLMPEREMMKTGNSNWSLDMKYISYDSYGNPASMTADSTANTIVLWGYNGQHPVAKAVSGHNIIAYTSFEDDGAGCGWTVPSLTRNTTYARTGNKCYNLSSGNITKTGLSKTVQYIISYWTRATAAISISNKSNESIKKGKTINGWTYYEHSFTPTTGSIALSGSGKIIDELRLYPADALMTTYTYKPLIGVTSETDPSGRIIFYEYDNANRLKLVRDEDGKILKDYQYQYKQQ